MAHDTKHQTQPNRRVHLDPPHVTTFIARLLPVARKVKKKWGVPIAVLVAQSALETAWGQIVKGNAYFGIKGKSSAGKSIVFTTHEVAGGKSGAVLDSFRAYDSLEEAADDYGQFLRNNPRYKGCFAFADQPDRFVDRLAAAGYATDPDYAKKLKSIIRSHRLATYDLPTQKA